MQINKGFASEFQQEAIVTRKMLERVPQDKYDWKPHEKSVTMKELSIHVVDMISWFPGTINQDEIDFAKGYPQPVIENNAQLLELFDKNVAEALQSLENTTDEHLQQNWKLRNGDEIYMDMPRFKVLRGMVLNHFIHHRAQLSVYLRMNDVPVPAIYGPSADEQAF